MKTMKCRSLHAMCVLFFGAISAANGQTISYFNTVFAFDGSRTVAGLVADADGYLYGTTNNISSSSGGLIFRTTIEGTSPQTLYQLGERDGYSPNAGLLLASDGYLYGTTHYGPPTAGFINSGTGTIFKVARDGTGFTTLHTFAASKQTVQGVGVDGNVLELIANTEGANPDEVLIEGTDGLLYGVAVNGGANGTGTIFRIAKDGTSFTVLYSFPANVEQVFNDAGAFPNGPLLQATDGRLYGVTLIGGSANRGTVYGLDTTGDGFAVVHSFPVLNLNPDTQLTNINDEGATPDGALLEVAGKLYGAASAGGQKGFGALYAVDKDGTAFTVLHHFDAVSDGSTPRTGVLLADDGRLYGSTQSGQAADTGETTAFGTLFAIATDGSGFEVLHTLTSAEGAAPGALVKLGTDTYFGTTQSSGACGSGGVFRFSLINSNADGHISCVDNSSSGGGGGIDGYMLALLFGMLLLCSKCIVTDDVFHAMRSWWE